MRAVALILVAMGFLSRFIPHPPNFTTLGAVVLFSGFYLRGAWKVIVPLSLMIASDILLNLVIYKVGFSPINLVVYGAVLLNLFLAHRLSHKPLVPKLAWGVPLASISFFSLTNLGVFAFSGMYPLNLQGLVACYVAAIPFFGNELAGTLLFTPLLVGIYEFAHVLRIGRVTARLF